MMLNGINVRNIIEHVSKSTITLPPLRGKLASTDHKLVVCPLGR